LRGLFGREGTTERNRVFSENQGVVRILSVASTILAIHVQQDAMHEDFLFRG